MGHAEHSPDHGEGGHTTTECEIAARAGFHAHHRGLELLQEASGRARLAQKSSTLKISDAMTICPGPGELEGR
jgi:hypothetical protein